MKQEIICSVFGLGKLGCPLAVILVSKGYLVIGVDQNTDVVQSLQLGLSHLQEPDLQTFIEQSREVLQVTEDPKEAILNSTVSFVIVPTPSDQTGAFNNNYIISAMESIGKALRKKASYHLVVIMSTVMPGSCEGKIAEALEKNSGRKIGENLGLCYNPAFIAIGSVIKNMLRPDMVLIGESDTKSGDILEKIYQNVCENNPAIERMSLINAELTKISINTFLTTKISYVNMLAEICEKLPGADLQKVTQAIGKDSRIGSKYLVCGLGYGGPCFPRDNIAFSALARTLGARADIAEATDQINNYQVEKLFTLIHKKLSLHRIKSTISRESMQTKTAKVGILGLSFKPDTNLIEASQGILLAKRLIDNGYQIYAYDPLAMETSKGLFLEEDFILCPSMEACIKNVDLVVIVTPWPEFVNISEYCLDKNSGHLVIIDCWRLLEPQKNKIRAHCDLVFLGQGPEKKEYISAPSNILELSKA